jgi:hypothetical protein
MSALPMDKSARKVIIRRISPILRVAIYRVVRFKGASSNNSPNFKLSVVFSLVYRHLERSSKFFKNGSW